MKNKLFEDGNRILFETDKEDELLLRFTDDLVDAKGNVKGTVKNKAAASAQIAVHLYKFLSSYHLPVRFKNQKTAKELTVKNATLLPFYNLMTIVENEGEAAASQIEFILVDDAGDRTVEIKELLKAEYASQEQLAEVRRFMLKMNAVLLDFFQRRSLKLLGFKAHFGILPNGKIGLCSELTLDTVDIKDANSRTKFTTAYLISHSDDAAELYDNALNAILF